MRRLIIVAFAVAACAPWTVVQRAEPNPLATQKFVALLPLDWTGVMIDGLTEQSWDETNDTDMKREWVVDRQLSGDEFRTGAFSRAGKRLQLVPGASPLTVKTTVVELKTGGIRPLFFTVRAQLLDPQGIVLDEIKVELKESSGGFHVGQFRQRLTRASREAGADVAEYFAQRAE